MKKTQKEIVKAKLLKEGKVSNFWAFHNYILRLGDIIYRLRCENMEIDGAFEVKQGKITKNYVYTLAK